MPLSRRSLLGRLLAAAGALLSLPGCRGGTRTGGGVAGSASSGTGGAAAATAGAGGFGIPAALEPALAAACDRLLPAERGLAAVVAGAVEGATEAEIVGAGAKEARVIEYLRRALTLPYYQTRRARILEGARRLDLVARRDWGRPFETLDAAAQDQVLVYIQGGGEDGVSAAKDAAEATGAPEADFEGEGWLHDLLELSLEGFLGDPVHGGNRDEVGWRLIGYSPEGPRPGACLAPCEENGGGGGDAARPQPWPGRLPNGREGRR
ncbi:MAG: gluconate 2-dehydrogenase subunit 3 family protein [Planctomycetes bacterium]|nr:gluconate 2-dehydrogenase subunit 3 family protein [Planctomycetota bacterium]